MPSSSKLQSIKPTNLQQTNHQVTRHHHYRLHHQQPNNTTSSIFNIMNNPPYNHPLPRPGELYLCRCHNRTPVPAGEKCPGCGFTIQEHLQHIHQRNNWQIHEGREIRDAYHQRYMSMFDGKEEQGGGGEQ
ncbi:hypothetical protein T440DRAFT_221845 [Plenodomus tracheiphilus IPT5]|uniref:Uncharacterized protein n=1 Tax=Plenodomus tracheiphilus IPT5 TaxID=1408161 RepID=A0A6A7AUE8_9PLEO|nr:hypothetical protein T440DRAFT_221845 [Plenodomus tracheiphilus IPT5]